VFVERDQQGRVEVVGAIRRGGVADRVIDPCEQVLAGDQRGRRVEVEVRGVGALRRRGGAQECPERRVHVVVVPADDLRLDERVRAQLAVFGVREELAGGEEVRRELAASRWAWMTPVSE
jgi:hypothetical protein